MSGPVQRYTRLLACCALLLSMLCPPATALGAAPAAAQPPHYKPGELLVVFKEGTDSSDRLQALHAAGAREKGAIAAGIHLVQVSDDPVQAAAKMKREPRVAAVSPNFIMKSTAAGVNDPLRPKQWALDAIGAGQAWDAVAATAPSKLPEVRVAVLDTGVDASHPDLRDRVDTGLARDFTDTGLQDAVGHGTHVGGIIAAATDNLTGVAGVAGKANVKLVPLKVLRDDGTGDLYTVLRALDYATSRSGGVRADIVNLSLGCGGCYSEVQAWFFAQAATRGSLIVAAAGNEGQDVKAITPGALPGVLTVAAQAENGTRSWFSNYGPEVDLAAPGSAILAPVPAGSQVWQEQAGYGPSRVVDNGAGGTYAYLDGTSMAAPVVAGVGALIKSLHPEYGRHELQAHLLATAQPPAAAGPEAWSPDFGFGQVRAARAAESLPDDVFARWSLKVERPWNGRALSGISDIAVDVDPTRIDQVRVEDDAGRVLAGIAPALADSDIWRTTLDSSRLPDGPVLLRFVGLWRGNPVTTQTARVVVANSQPTAGMRVKVLAPDGRPVPEAVVRVMRRQEGGAYEALGAALTDPSGDALPLDGIAGAAGSDCVVTATFFWYDPAADQHYWVEYRRNAVPPASLTLDGNDVRPVTVAVTDARGTPFSGDLYWAPLDPAGGEIVPATGPGSALVSATPAPNGASSVAHLLISPGTYNFVFVGHNTHLYLDALKVTVPSGNRYASPVTVGMDATRVTTVHFESAYGADSQGAEFIPNPRTKLSPALWLDQSQTAQVASGSYEPLLLSYASDPAGGQHGYLLSPPGPVQWLGADATLRDGLLHETHVSVLPGKAAPGQAVTVHATFATTAGMNLRGAYQLDSMSAPAGGSLLRELVAQQDQTGTPAAAAQPYIRLTRAVDGELWHSQDLPQFQSNAITLPRAGLRGEYWARVGVNGLGPIMGDRGSVEGAALISIDAPVTSGVRVRVTPPAGAEGSSRVRLYQVAPGSASATAYRPAGEALTEPDGSAWFPVPPGGDYVATVTPEDDAPTGGYVLTAAVKSPGEAQLDGRKAVRFTVRTAPGAPAALADASLYLTTEDGRGLPVDTIWAGALAGGSRTLLLTPGWYKTTLIDEAGAYQLTQRFEARAAESSYTLKTAPLGLITLAPPDDPNSAWQAAVRPAGTLLQVPRSPDPVTGKISLYVTPGSYEVWTEQAQALADGRLRRMIFTSPPVPVPALNQSQSNGAAVHFGGDLRISVTPVQPSLTQGLLRADVTVADAHGNRIREVWVASQGPDPGDRAVTPMLLVTNPAYSQSVISDPAVIQWDHVLYRAPADQLPGTYSVQVEAHIPGLEPIRSAPMNLAVAAKGPGNLALSGTALVPGGGRKLTARYNPAQPGHITVQVLAPNGAAVATLARDRLVKPGEALTFAWDLRTPNGGPVPAGMYQLSVFHQEANSRVAQSLRVGAGDLGWVWAAADRVDPAGEAPAARLLMLPDRTARLRIAVVKAGSDAELAVLAADAAVFAATPEPAANPYSWAWQLPADVAPGAYSFKLTDLTGLEQPVYVDFTVAGKPAGDLAVQPAAPEPGGDLPWFAVDGRDVAFSFTPAVSGTVRAAVTDRYGGDVKLFASALRVTAGKPVLLRWNGLTATGTVAALGLYHMQISYAGAGSAGQVVRSPFGVAAFNGPAGVALSTDRLQPGPGGSMDPLTISIEPLAGLTTAPFTVKVLNAAGTVVATFATDAKARSWSWNGKGQDGRFVPDGEYRIAVTAPPFLKDPATAAVTVQGTKVLPPVINPPDPFIADPMPLIAGSAGAGAAVTVLLNDTPLKARDGSVLIVTADPEGHWEAALPRLGDGVHRLRARQTDPASGLTSDWSPQVSFTLNTRRPVITLTAPSAPSKFIYRKSSSYRLEGAVSPNSTAGVKLFLDGSATPTLTMPTDAAGRFGLTLPLADGPHQVRLEAEDRAGNRSAPVTRELLVDTVAPAVSKIQLWSGQSQAAPFSPVALKRDGTGSVTAVTYVIPTAADVRLSASLGELPDGTGQSSLTLNGRPLQDPESVPLSLGPNQSHTFLLTQTDAAGNRTQVSIIVKVDTVAPAVTVTTPTSRQYLNAARPGPLKLTARVSEPIDLSTLTVFRQDLDNALNPTGQPVAVTPDRVEADQAGTLITLSVPVDADGSFRFSVSAADRAGNVTLPAKLALSAPVIRDTTAPVISGLPDTQLITTTRLRLSGLISDDRALRLMAISRAGTVGASRPLAGDLYDLGKETITLTDQAVNRFRIVASDEAGNSTEAYVTAAVKTRIANLSGRAAYTQGHLRLSDLRTDRPLSHAETTWCTSGVATVKAGTTEIWSGQVSIDPDGRFTIADLPLDSEPPTVTLTLEIAAGGTTLIRTVTLSRK